MADKWETAEAEAEQIYDSVIDGGTSEPFGEALDLIEARVIKTVLTGAAPSSPFMGVDGASPDMQLHAHELIRDGIKHAIAHAIVNIRLNMQSES